VAAKASVSGSLEGGSSSKESNIQPDGARCISGAHRFFAKRLIPASILLDSIARDSSFPSFFSPYS
jgi:hypothetical protein